MNARRLKSTMLATLGALLGVLALWSPVAAGQITHKHLFDISEVPASAGAPVSGLLESMGAITIDSGKLYGVTATKLNVFDPTSGSFISQFPLTKSLELRPRNVAVNHASGEVYLPEEPPASEAGVVAVYDKAGGLESTWDGADTPLGRLYCFFCRNHAVAVDNSTNLADWAAGDVYVTESVVGAINVFKPAPGGGETYVTQLTAPEPGVSFSPNDVAVDSAGRVVVLDGEAVDIFEPTVLNEYSLVKRITATPAGPLAGAALTVDGGNGDIFVLSGYPHTAIDQFSAAGTYIGETQGDTVGTFESGGANAIAVDPTTHDIYLNMFNHNHGLIDVLGPDVVVPDVTIAPASSIKPRSATLSGTVNPANAGVASCQFEYGTSAGLGSVAPCPASVPDGGSPVEVQAQIAELQPNTTYYYRLQAENGNDAGFGEKTEIKTFTTPGPSIVSESTSSLASVSSTLNASIDPNNVTTSYYFQYGTSTAYGTDLPAAPGVTIGSGAGALPVNVHLQGLTPGTTYHFRVVIVAEVGGEPFTLPGPDRTFITQAAGAELTQPDGRNWEMVTPPNKQGSGLIPIGSEGGDVIQAAENGDGLAFAANAPLVENPSGSRSAEITQGIASRRAPGSWEAQDITTEHNEGPSQLAGGHWSEYKLFSSDLSQGLVEPAGHTALPPLPDGAEKTVYLRQANGEFKALVTAENVLAGAHFGGDGEQNGGIKVIAGNRDLSAVGIDARVALTSTPPSECGSLLWAAGKLTCTGVYLGISSDGGAFKNERNTISTDGSRVIGAAAEGHRGIELHDMRTNEFVQVDAAQGNTEPSVSESVYITASADGSRVFFSSPQRLTADSTAVRQSDLEEDGDLYEFELTSAHGEPLAGKLTDLTVDAKARESAGLQGVIGASEDGSSVYFVAQGVLGDGAAHGAVPGHNLYVARYDTTTKGWEAPQFIAALSNEDSPSWGDNGAATTGSRFLLGDLTARVSPNGRYLAFMSDRSLTGYDNRDANAGAADEEVFLYDADAARLVCSSCNPTGERPTGVYRGFGYQERLIDWTIFLWEGRWLAANIPGWTQNTLSTSLYQSRYLSSSGRMFFNSSDALVPADVNGKEDVYQYEPAGVGSCQPPSYGQSASVVFSEAMDGCVGLISAGTSNEESDFVDASESGGDVFFLTTSQLSPQDTDHFLDIYDAHECTTVAPCAPAAALTPPPCATGDSCKPAPTPQPTLFGAPPSQTFSGAGNVAPSASKSTGKPKTGKPKPTGRALKLSTALKACRKKSRHSRGACERRARKRYAAKRANTGKNLSAKTGR